MSPEIDFEASTLEPGVDIDAIDTTKLDRGDLIEPPEEKPAEALNKGAEDKGAEDVDPEEDVDPTDSPRDDKGRFAEKEPKIPKSRFDEQVGKEREAREAAERRAAELEQQLSLRQGKDEQGKQLEAVDEKLDALESSYQELILDGNAEEAAAVRKEIRSLERQLARYEAEQLAAQSTSQILEGERFNVVVARLEADYPALNPNSEHFDQDLCDLVLSRQRTLMQQEGLSPSQAMARAAEKVAERFLKPSEGKDPKGLAKAQEDRKQEQLRKNLDTMTKQPASMKSSGLDSDKLGQNDVPDAAKMTYEEFCNLPDSTLAKMRGDFLS